MKTVLITGASAGLGMAIAKELISLDYHLILTARASSLHRFEERGVEESEKLWIRSMDVRNPREREAVVEEIVQKLGGVDILINNAGIAYRSVVEHVTDDERMEQMEINFRAPMELTRLCLPKMREKRDGRVINISSVGGMMAMPTMSVYSASKWALEGASEALYYEVKPWNIKVTLVEPGFINSSGFKKVRYTDLSGLSKINFNDPYYGHYRYMTPFIERVMRLTVATPKSVAKTVVRVMQQRNPQLRVPGTLDAVFFYYMRRLIPRRIYHWTLYRNLPRVKKWGKK